MTKLIRWDTENVKRIKAVRIDVDGSLTQITGKNGQGKSSCIDALESALGGKKSEPVEPVRKGESGARTVVELDEITVTKTWNESGVSSLMVKSNDGVTFAKPQAMLDALVGKLSFDPLAFMVMPAKEQLVLLKKIAGLDFGEIESEEKRVFEQRTNVNRDHKKAVSTCEQQTADGWANGPDAEVKITDLINERANAESLQQEKQAAVNVNIEREEQARKNADEIARLQEESRLLGQAVAKTEKRIKEIIVPDINALTAKIEGAEDANQKARNKATLKENQAARDKFKKLSDGHTKRLEELANEKTEMVENANMPIEGLSFAENEVLFNDLSLKVASQSQQLRISAAIGLALNPNLRILLMRNGSLLDSEAMQELATFAEEHDAQIIIERVTDGEAIGIVIEDGEVKE